MLIKPKYNHEQGYFEWNELEVKEATNREAGLGLFATVDLPANTVIPYLGVKIERPLTIEEVEKNCYIAEIVPNELYIDASPENDDENEYIAGYINEPSSSQIANAVLCRVDDGVYVITLYTIPAGQEILMTYNISTIEDNNNNAMSVENI